MILPGDDIRALQKGELGEVVVDDPPQVGQLFWVRRSPRAVPVCRARVVDVWPLAAGRHAALLERVPDDFEVPERRPAPKPSLRLTRAQRAKLFNRESPHIGGEGTPPVKAGVTLRLSARVTLTVLRVDVKNGKWRLHYELRDTRDSVRLLRRTPPAHREGDELDITDTDAIRVAAEQSFYTSTPEAAISDAGEAPDRGWVDARHAAIREFDHQRRLARHAEKLREQGRERSKARRKRAA